MGVNVVFARKYDLDNIVRDLCFVCGWFSVIGLEDSVKGEGYDG